MVSYYQKYTEYGYIQGFIFAPYLGLPIINPFLQYTEGAVYRKQILKICITKFGSVRSQIFKKNASKLDQNIYFIIR